MPLRVHDPRTVDAAPEWVSADPYLAAFAADFVILDTVPERRLWGLGASIASGVSLDRYSELIHRVIQVTGKFGFAACDPHPDRMSVSLSNGRALILHESALCLIFEPCAETIRHLLSHQGAEGYWREWAFGSCTDPAAMLIDPPNTSSAGLAGWLGHPELVGCFFWQEEGWVQMMIRLSPELDDLIASLKELSRVRPQGAP